MRTILYRFDLAQHRELISGKLSKELKQKLLEGVSILEQASKQEKKKPGRKPVGDDTKCRVVELRGRGLSLRQISEEVGVSHTTVRVILAREAKLLKTKEK